ncbi:hypothetical protein [Tessaracoccus sp. MC1756]|nr:hypothetical protein [Tessaracoccus sp. MC1756]
MKQETRDQLERTGFIDKVGDGHIFATLPTAGQAYVRRRRPHDQA